MSTYALTIMPSQASFSGFDFVNTWRIYEGNTTPLLKSLLTPLTITANNISKVYDGQLDVLSLTGINYSNPVAANSANLFGISTPFANVTKHNVGTYSANLWSNQQGYDLTIIGGQLSVTPAVLTATITAPNKTYDGTAAAAPMFTITTGLIGNENVTATGTATFNSKDVLTANLVTADSNVLVDGYNGGLASNYSLVTGQTVTANITPVALSVNIIGSPTKVYDGTTSAALSSANYGTVGGFVLAEGATLNGPALGTYNSPNVLVANLVGAILAPTNFTANSGTLLSNYILPMTATGAANITPAALSATITAPNKTYDGTAAAAPTFTITTGLIGNENVTATGTATFNSKDVLTANLVTADSNVLVDGYNGGLASNYSLVTGQTVTANITPAGLSASADAVSKLNNRLVITGTPNGIANSGGFVITPSGVYSTLYNISYSNNFLTIVSSPTSSGLTGGVYATWYGVWKSSMPRLLAGL